MRNRSYLVCISLIQQNILWLHILFLMILLFTFSYERLHHKRVCALERHLDRGKERLRQSNIQPGLSPCFSAQCHPAPICRSPLREPPEPVQVSESYREEEREWTSKVEFSNEKLKKSRVFSDCRKTGHWRVPIWVNLEHWLLVVDCAIVLSPHTL